MQKKRLPKVMITSYQSETGARVHSLGMAGPTCPELPTSAGGPGSAASEAIDAQTPMSAGKAQPLVPGDVPTSTQAADPVQTKGQDASQAALRRSCAEQIVKRHATLAGFGGIIPLPLVNIAGITAVILRMVRTLARLYGVPFERDKARSVVISLLGGTMPTGLAVATTSTLIYLIPGSNVVGLAVSSITAVACTRGIGRIFIDHFERGGTLPELHRSEA
jgi:uncharacterized protein (DUF697 family)